jgi:hypothetical protein
VITIDEIQNYLEDETPLDPEQPKGKKRGQRVPGLLTFIAKTVTAAGFVLFPATQNPDSQVSPDKLRGPVRQPLRTQGHDLQSIGDHPRAGGLPRRNAQIAPGRRADCSALEAGEAVTMRTHLLHIKAIRAARNRIVSRSNLRNTTGHLGRPLFRGLRPARREAAALSGMCGGVTIQVIDRGYVNSITRTVVFTRACRPHPARGESPESRTPSTP